MGNIKASFIFLTFLVYLFFIYFLMQRFNIDTMIYDL